MPPTSWIDSATNSGDLSGCAALDQIFDIVRIFAASFPVIAAMGSPVGVWQRRMMHPEGVRNVELPGVLRGEPHRRLASSMVTVPKSNEVIVSGECSRHEAGQVVCFRA